MKRIKNFINDKISANVLAFLNSPELLKWSEVLTESTASIYDKALDSEYLKGLSGGGGNHRLFDNGHDIFGAWDKVKEASDTDTFTQEVVGYVSSLWKDVTTTKGLPFKTLDKESYEQWAEIISDLNIPGVDKSYIYDLMSFDVFEVLGSAISVAGVALALKKEDKEKLSEILASMGVVSIASANPLMGILLVVSAAYAYKKKKMEVEKKGLIKGSVVTAASLTVFSILGLPILFELVIAIMVTTMIKKSLFEKNDLKAVLTHHFVHIKAKLKAG